MRLRIVLHGCMKKSLAEWTWMPQSLLISAVHLLPLSLYLSFFCPSRYCMTACFASARYDREGLLETPDRIARMYEEIFGGMDMDAAEPLKKRFHASNNEMVVEKDITFYSTCEHHMLPFYGKAHVAYIPNGEVVGISKLARTVEIYARRLQIQEQLTAQVADALMEQLKPKGVMVMMEAEHMCMTMRGIKKPGSRTVTYVTRGIFNEDERLVNKFFQMVR